MDIDKYFEELNEMANFKNFGESKEEEITIDGVDVAGCVRLQDDKMSCDLGGDCKGWDNCYYKQLKRLQQENADLKKYIERMDEPELQVIDADIALENAELKAYKDVNEDFKTAWEELKAENERLNRCLMEELHHEGEKIRETIKYKQTLQEIKAIAETPKPFKDFSEIKTATEVEYDYAATCNELELRLHKVLELITKAEEE